MTIFDDGEVAWEGIEHVGVVGPARSSIPIDDARQIQAHFRGLEPPPPAHDAAFRSTSDQPSVVIEDGSRRVVHDYGSSREPLLGTESLAEDIDALVGVQQWTEASCAGASSTSLVFGTGIEFDVQSRDFNEEALSAVVSSMAESQGNVARLRVVGGGLARRRAAFVEHELATRGVDPNRVVIRLLDRGFDGPQGWDDDMVWIDYGSQVCI